MKKYLKVLETGAPCCIGYNVTVRHAQGSKYTLYTRKGMYKLTGATDALSALERAKYIDAILKGKSVYRACGDCKIEVTEVMEVIKINGVYEIGK